VPSPMETGSRPDSFMGGMDGADADIGLTCAGAAEKQVSVVAVGLE